MGGVVGQERMGEGGMELEKEDRGRILTQDGVSARVSKLTRSLYDLAICAFGVATLHFSTEWLVFGTVKLNRGSIGPLLVGSSGVVWALTQRDYYLGRL